MLNTKKLFTKILTQIGVAEQLEAQATLIRLANLRILVLSGYQGANSTLAVPSADKPSASATVPTMRTDSNGRATALGYMSVSTSTGYVQRYYAGTYNASGAGVSNVAATDKTYGIAAWVVGGVIRLLHSTLNALTLGRGWACA